MKMRCDRFILLLLILSVIGMARSETFQSYANVVNVQPIIETTYKAITRRMCSEPDSRVHVSKPLATTIGEDIRKQKRAWRAQTSCTTVTEKQPQKKITAYRVTYRYRGHTKTTRLSYHPGERIPINVRLSPLP